MLGVPIKTSGVFTGCLLFTTTAARKRIFTVRDQTMLVLNRTSVIESLVPNRTNIMGGQHQYSTGSGLLAPTSNNSISYDFLPTVSLTVPPTN